MTQATPTQELVAKDLHGYEWKFKHIFRGNTFVQSQVYFVNQCHVSCSVSGKVQSLFHLNILL